MSDGRVLRFKFQGVEYRVDQSDITGRLERELWKATELSLAQLMQATVAGASFGLAGVVWLARRLNGERVTYESVEQYIDSLTADDIDVELLGDDEEVAGDPQL